MKYYPLIVTMTSGKVIWVDTTGLLKYYMYLDNFSIPFDS